jgi:hypothetical protein
MVFEGVEITISSTKLFGMTLASVRMTNILVEEILGVHLSFLGGAINLVDLNFL